MKGIKSFPVCKNYREITFLLFDNISKILRKKQGEKK